ncbi:AEC family transporter [Magnetospirillum sp. J10]|uniref:AEC family transporter n=2 Tax=Magnetospirillum sulfuroxidans TaxID=611300 RepID=A0ABS5IBX6_9PROT|nr:AEC family transporter [Magnetospirillum sulfuroxidans]
MLTILTAIIPNFLLIMLGWGMRSRHWLDISFWGQAERLTYYLLLPALLITNLAEARLDGLPVAAIAAAQGLAILAVLGLIALPLRRFWPRLATDGPAFTSLIQGSVRPNTYIAFAVAAALWGPSGVTVAAVSAALVVPLVNLLCVTALIQWGQGDGRRGFGPTLAAIVKNPLILACLLGAALNLSGIGLPPMIGPMLKIMAQASLALGLLCVGAGLDLGAIRGAGMVVATTLTIKLLALPSAVAGLGWLFGLRGVQLAAAIVYAAVPVATNAYVLARQLGGDYRLAAAIITASTLAAAATLPVAAIVIARLP